MGHATFKIGDLEAVIGDNADHEGHRAGYNGIWSLRHKRSKRNLFVPAYAGFNLEHYFNGETEFLNNEVFFQPRKFWRMKLITISIIFIQVTLILVMINNLHY